MALTAARNPEQKQSWKKKALIACGIAVLLLVLMNFNFFWANLKFTFVKPKVVSTHEKVKLGLAPNTLLIESLSITAPVIYPDIDSENIFQEGLKRGVVHYPGTASPGEYGNVYIFGHSSDYAFSGGSFKTIFALLPRIEKGAEVVLSDNSGNEFTYKVVDTRIVAPSEVQYLDQGGYHKKRLTLQTSYPLGTALKRFLVIAEMPEDTTEPTDPNAS